MVSCKYTRREFLRNSSLACLGSLYLGTPFRAGDKRLARESVVLIRNKTVLDRSGHINKNILKAMLDEALITLTGESSEKKAWKSLIKAEDIVGIKSNHWSRLPTPAELEKILEESVAACGVPVDNISTNDRSVRSDPVFKKSTAMINVRPLRTHDWSGVGSLIKNYIMFVPRPRDYHPDTCADLAKIWQLSALKGKTRLNILVMLTPLFHGTGPHHFNPAYTWPYCGLLVGFDPVAVDATGLRILQAKRNDYFGEKKPINPAAKHIMFADTRHHLGTADPSQIKVLKLGWKQDRFI